jgi:D-alanyl-D-alanine endopeptidase (penicillin-binding protein 7)
MLRFLIILLFPLSGVATTTAVYNSTTDTIIQGNLCCEKVSIASISKLMTVYTVLTKNQNLDEKLTVADNKITHTKLSKGMVISRIDLVKLSLVSSDNLAALTLAQNYPGGQSQFVLAMNNYSKQLNMRYTGFVEPTGLSIMNFSTTGDIIKITNAIMQYKIVRDSAKIKELIVPVTKNKKSFMLHSYPTSVYFGDENIVAIKTGFTNAAGFCITLVVNSNNQFYNLVVLGSKSVKERNNRVQELMGKLTP